MCVCYMVLYGTITYGTYAVLMRSYFVEFTTQMN